MAVQEFPRRGAWAVVDGNTGIVTGMSGGTVNVDMVDMATGDTTVAVAVDRAAVRQALRMEIPEARRPSVEDAAKFGYE
jgi:hypothetical protein